MQKDNSTLESKILIRKRALEHLDSEPVILESHGGYGVVFDRCYFNVKQGVVFEKDAKKAVALSLQRPTWSVYECDCEDAIRGGAGAHIKINFVDLDPYGSPWECVDGLFKSKRNLDAKLVIVVNDGLRMKAKIGTAYNTKCLNDKVLKYGNNSIFGKYLEICRELMQEKGAEAGYSLDSFNGYYCGHAKQMTHYFAVFTHTGGAKGISSGN